MTFRLHQSDRYTVERIPYDDAEWLDFLLAHIHMSECPCFRFFDYVQLCDIHLYDYYARDLMWIEAKDEEYNQAMRWAA